MQLKINETNYATYRTNLDYEILSLMCIIIKYVSTYLNVEVGTKNGIQNLHNTIITLIFLSSY